MNYSKLIAASLLLAQTVSISAVENTDIPTQVTDMTATNQISETPVIVKVIKHDLALIKNKTSEALAKGAKAAIDPLVKSDGHVTPDLSDVMRDGIDSNTIPTEQVKSIWGNITTKTQNLFNRAKNSFTQTKEELSKKLTTGNDQSFLKRSYETAQNFAKNTKNEVVNFVKKTTDGVTTIYKENKYYSKYLAQGFCGVVVIGGVVYLVDETFGLQETKDFVVKNGKIVLAGTAAAVIAGAIGYYFAKDQVKTALTNSMNFAQKHLYGTTAAVATIAAGTYFVKHTELGQKLKNALLAIHF